MNRFTEEVIKTFQGQDAAERVALMKKIGPADGPETLKTAFLVLTAPSMMLDDVPAYAANIVYHALTECVDWREVSLSFGTDAEAN
jgi:hypothetical protein